MFILGWHYSKKNSLRLKTSPWRCVWFEESVDAWSLEVHTKMAADRRQMVIEAGPSVGQIVAEAMD